MTEELLRRHACVTTEEGAEMALVGKTEHVGYLLDAVGAFA